MFDATPPSRRSGKAFPRLGTVGPEARHHPSLKDLAEDYIRLAIVSGELAPGQRIDQDAVAADMGISRLPIREALIELTAKGYVRSVPRRGSFVVKLTHDDIIDHFDTVSRVFGLAARRAATQIGPNQLEELKRIHEKILATADQDRDRELNVEFYQIVNRLGSSERLLLTLQFLALALPNDFYMSSPSWSATEAVYRERLLVAMRTRTRR